MIDEHIQHWIRDALPEISHPHSFSWSALYECWEWQERQAKLVVNGQRLYDFFGYRWALPLWDNIIMDFFVSLPLHHKFNQSLYITCLRQLFPCGLFQNLSMPPMPWPGRKVLILWAGRAVGLLAGQDRKNRFFHYMAYHNTSHYLYALFGHAVWQKNWHRMRGTPSLFAEDMLARLVERGFSIPDIPGRSALPPLCELFDACYCDMPVDVRLG